MLPKQFDAKIKYMYKNALSSAVFILKSENKTLGRGINLQYVLSKCIYRSLP